MFVGRVDFIHRDNVQNKLGGTRAACVYRVRKIISKKKKKNLHPLDQSKMGGASSELVPLSVDLKGAPKRKTNILYLFGRVSLK